MWHGQTDKASVAVLARHFEDVIELWYGNFKVVDFRVLILFIVKFI